MGVAGLWEPLQPTSEVFSLTRLAVEKGYKANPSGHRAFRLGIDASIWFFHSKNSIEGENPEIRMIFFRVAKLLCEPIIPFFVFDGPLRPSWKRGVRVSGNASFLLHGVKSILKAFGVPWHQAPGEAEAELAYLNRIGLIDGIMSDDVDNFLFGARVVIRNPSMSLSGNANNPVLNSNGKDDKNHVRVFDAAKIEEHPTLGLTRAGFILIALLSGGDYKADEIPGSYLHGCGIKTAMGLARAGFGDELLHAVDTLSDPDLRSYLNGWRQALQDEIRTNARGLLTKKSPSLASKVTSNFPNLDILKAYAQPVTSEDPRHATRLNTDIAWTERLDLAEVAAVCEDKFEWGTIRLIPKRFANIMWKPLLVNYLRLATLEMDGVKFASGARGSAQDLLTNITTTIYSSREHVIADSLLEYRLGIDSSSLLDATKKGIRGTREEPVTAASYKEDCGDDLDDSPNYETSAKCNRLWIPATLLKKVLPDIVREFEEKEELKRRKKEMPKSPRKKIAASPSKPRAKKAVEADPSLKATKTKASRAVLKSTDRHLSWLSDVSEDESINLDFLSDSDEELDSPGTGSKTSLVDKLAKIRSKRAPRVNGPKEKDPSPPLLPAGPSRTFARVTSLPSTAAASTSADLPFSQSSFYNSPARQMSLLEKLSTVGTFDVPWPETSKSPTNGDSNTAKALKPRKQMQKSVSLPQTKPPAKSSGASMRTNLRDPYASQRDVRVREASTASRPVSKKHRPPSSTNSDAEVNIPKSPRKSKQRDSPRKNVDIAPLKENQNTAPHMLPPLDSSSDEEDMLTDRLVTRKSQSSREGGVRSQKSSARRGDNEIVDLSSDISFDGAPSPKAVAKSMLETSMRNQAYEKTQASTLRAKASQKKDTSQSRLMMPVVKKANGDLDSKSKMAGLNSGASTPKRFSSPIIDLSTP